ncbi:MAG: class I SAM-dependent methyltransferase, partial [Clostridia bacterium]|nr:class I SAM-dependent methyltransferase [Clostridia bacterium]
MEFLDFWNNAFRTYKVDKIKYAKWLDAYQDIIKSCKTSALDLGCGAGSDSYYLTQKGLDVIACDYSPVALETAIKEAPKAKTMLVDVSKPLPFDDNSFDLVVADLSLHYFDTETTIKIMQEIKRILTKNGHLLARVNSTA